MLSALILRALLVIYIFMLIKIILLKFHSLDLGFLWGRLLAGLQQSSLLSQRLDTGNLVPFREISRSLHSLGYNDFVNLLGNVTIFMPLGILLGIMFNDKRNSWMRILIGSSFLSLGLETAQLLFMIGQFDVDDILLNSLGGLLGFLIYRSAIITFRRLLNEKKI
ncbi:VanZ family protein [Paenibacillus paridis]|uniref:VanZ family protein n=1 Tax=Paenibacillus paridis TaxID=2583376 RepID=UPI001391D3EC|nr:VanZ family protein [Paenibacillus paridis]